MPTAAPSRILVVEDEPSISDVISTALRHEGHTVTLSAHGRNALGLAIENDFELIVLDVMLPSLDGFEVCRQLRDRGVQTPVLFVTARDEPDDRIKGFVTGGDDYMTKPFRIEELTLRVTAILRRTGHTPSTNILSVGDLTLDPTAHEVRRKGLRIDLSPTEFRLLNYLMLNKGVVVSKAQILVNVWDDGEDLSENVVELYIGYLRRKIHNSAHPLIHTRRGAGYVVRVEPE